MLRQSCLKIFHLGNVYLKQKIWVNEQTCLFSFLFLCSTRRDTRASRNRRPTLPSERRYLTVVMETSTDITLMSRRYHFTKFSTLIKILITRAMMRVKNWFHNFLWKMREAMKLHTERLTVARGSKWIFYHSTSINSYLSCMQASE